MGLVTQNSPVGWTNESRASWMERAAPEGATEKRSSWMDGSVPAACACAPGGGVCQNCSRSCIGVVGASAVRLLGGAHGARKHIVQPPGILEPDTDADERAGHAIPRRPIEFSVVREDGVRAREGEVGAEAGALCAREGIEEGLRCSWAGEREREQPAEAAAGQAAARGIVRGGLPFGIEDFGDRRGWTLLSGRV